MDRNLGEYIDLLNTNDWSVFHRSQPATRADPFWPDTQKTTGDIADILSGDALDAEMSGLDVYDPAFEDEFNTLPETWLSWEEEWFWFTTDGQTSDTQESADDASQSELLNLIKQHELTK